MIKVSCETYDHNWRRVCDGAYLKIQALVATCEVAPWSRSTTLPHTKAMLASHVYFRYPVTLLTRWYLYWCANICISMVSHINFRKFKDPLQWMSVEKFDFGELYPLHLHSNEKCVCYLIAEENFSGEWEVVEVLKNGSTFSKCPACIAGLQICLLNSFPAFETVYQNVRRI